jgi:uncharacterized Tic20 family protein
MIQHPSFDYFMLSVNKINLRKIFPPLPTGGGLTPQPKDRNERVLGAMAHLMPVLGPILPPHIWILTLLPPFVFWQIKRGQSQYLGAVGKEVLNFQIQTGGILSLSSLMGLIPTLGMLFNLAVTMGCCMALVLMAMAAVDSVQGKFFYYPWVHRLIK